MAHNPWVNGSVESCMRHVQAACRALLSELKLGLHDWPLVIGLVMSALNDAPLKRLGKKPDGAYRSSLEVFTGLVPERTQLRIAQHTANHGKSMQMDCVNATQRMAIDNMQSALDAMHNEIIGKVSKNRMKHIRVHNKNINLISLNFTLRDFGVLRRAQDKGHKMSF